MAEFVALRLVSVPRFISFMERKPSAKLRLFTAQELEHCARFTKAPDERLAARFAAKCAVRSIVPGLCWMDVCIVNDALGAPHIDLPSVQFRVGSVSLSHDTRWAVAAVAVGSED